MNLTPRQLSDIAALFGRASLLEVICFLEISERPNQTHRQIEFSINQEHSGCWKAIHKLESAGWVRRYKTDDCRRYRCEVTDAGRRALREIVG